MMGSGIPPGLPGPWLDEQKLAEFWGYVKWFMKYNMPAFMIVAAVFVVGMVLDMLNDIPLTAKREQERTRHDDDDDLEVKYY
ncbi:hypothetical protein, partial [Paenibacillus macerans]|uniref:hypothetical protein n=1 Tax=Paenibacillus macerans TaxID=44252 RepID=UPI000F5851E6